MEWSHKIGRQKSKKKAPNFLAVNFPHSSFRPATPPKMERNFWIPTWVLHFEGAVYSRGALFLKALIFNGGTSLPSFFAMCLCGSIFHTIPEMLHHHPLSLERISLAKKNPRFFWKCAVSVEGEKWRSLYVEESEPIFAHKKYRSQVRAL